jgi:hypothetical protein
MPQIYFITFGGPNKNFHDAVNRICSEAEQIKIFDKIIGYTEQNLMDDKKFWNKHGNFITNNQRGYGYWFWKSYLTKKTMKEMNDNDILVYADAGCTINSNGKQRLLEYFDIVNNSEFGTLSFSLEHLEKTWTKMDLINELNAYDKLNTLQLVGGIFILRKCNNTINLIKEWYKLMCNYHFINDTPSILPNDPSFIEHRHDQSCFSLLRKKYGSIVLNDETNRHIWHKNEYANFPIYRKFT